MKTLSKIAAGAFLGASALALTATTASARIVCNADGDCWHTTTVYQYPPAAGVVVHEDDWKWGQASTSGGASMKAAATRMAVPGPSSDLTRSRA